MTPTMSSGRAMRRKRTSRLCERALPRGRPSARVGADRVKDLSSCAMVEDVDILAPGYVQQGAMGQEIEAGLGELHPTLPAEHRVEPGPKGVKMDHVGGGIGELFRRQLG